MEAKIESKYITDFHFHFPAKGEQIEAATSVKGRFGKSSSKGENTAVIEINVRIDSADNDFLIELTEEIVYSFNEDVRITDELLNEIFTNEGINIVSDDLDNALNGIGKPKINIKHSIKN